MLRSTKTIKGFSKITSTASAMALTLMLLISVGCVIKSADPQEMIIQREKAAGEKSNAHTADFENGLIPWISLELIIQ